MSNPLPVEQGTKKEVVLRAFELLKKRIQNHGGELSENDANFNLLIASLKAQGIRTATTAYSAEELLNAMWKAVCDNFNQVAFTKIPMQLYDRLHSEHARRLQLRDDLRRQKSDVENLLAKDDAFNNILGVQQERQAKSAADLKAAEESATAEIARLIQDYCVFAGPNRLNHAASEEGRAFLKKIKVTLNGKYSAVETLRAVQAARWADSVEQMSRAYDHWIAEQNNAKKNEREQRLARERSGHVGAFGR